NAGDIEIPVIVADEEACEPVLARPSGSTAQPRSAPTSTVDPAKLGRVPARTVYSARRRASATRRPVRIVFGLFFIVTVMVVCVGWWAGGGSARDHIVPGVASTMPCR